MIWRGLRALESAKGFGIGLYVRAAIASLLARDWYGRALPGVLRALPQISRRAQDLHDADIKRLQGAAQPAKPEPTLEEVAREQLVGNAMMAIWEALQPGTAFAADLATVNEVVGWLYDRRHDLGFMCEEKGLLKFTVNESIDEMLSIVDWDEVPRGTSIAIFALVAAGEPDIVERLAEVARRERTAMETTIIDMAENDARCGHLSPPLVVAPAAAEVH